MAIGCTFRHSCAAFLVLVGDGLGLADLVGVGLGLADLVGVGLADFVGLGLAVFVGLGDFVGLGLAEALFDGEALLEGLGVALADLLADALGVALAVGFGVLLALADALAVALALAVAVLLALALAVFDGVALGVDTAASSTAVVRPAGAERAAVDRAGGWPQALVAELTVLAWAGPPVTRLVTRPEKTRAALAITLSAAVPVRADLMAAPWVAMVIVVETSHVAGWSHRLCADTIPCWRRPTPAMARQTVNMSPRPARDTIIVMGIIDPLDVLTRPAGSPDRVLRYGPGPEHVADLRVPSPGGRRTPARTGPASLVVLLHGGFWRAAYDRAHLGPMAAALADEGYVVCTPEFRRVGQPGGGWPGTFDDIASAVDTLPGLVGPAVSAVPASRGVAGGGRVVLAGHSAGGHLALWAAARHRLGPRSAWRADPGPGIDGVVALAPVSDLGACYRAGLSDNAAGELLGGGPRERPDRYAAADPAALVPLGVPVRIVHGGDDATVPCAMSRRFVAHAQAAGDDMVLTELVGRGHFDVIDPLSTGWPAVLDAFRRVCSC